VIEAGSKRTGGGSTFTVCDYYTAGYAEYLGQFESDEFASSEADAVLSFCVDHAAERA
jgi:hypothetical protein